MPNATRRLQLSLIAQAEIEHTWHDLVESDWLLIEEEALSMLTAEVTLKAELFSLPILSEFLPKYIGFEQSEIDARMLEAAFFVFGRPAFAGHNDAGDSLDSQTDYGGEDPMLKELESTFAESYFLELSRGKPPVVHHETSENLGCQTDYGIGDPMLSLAKMPKSFCHLRRALAWSNSTEMNQGLFDGTHHEDRLANARKYAELPPHNVELRTFGLVPPSHPARPNMFRRRYNNVRQHR